MKNTEEIEEKIKEVEAKTLMHEWRLKSTISIIQKFSSSDPASKPIEFFFYADSKKKAEELSSFLVTNYSYEVYGIHKSKNDKKWSITGVTERISLKDESMKLWIEEMNNLAFLLEVDFDGWGTLI